MLSPSDFNNAVPQFTNGNYASNPLNPQYIAEPSSTEYNRGVEPIQTLPAQWWNWFMNKFTGRFNKVNVYVKNIFNELSQLLSLVSETPSGTEADPTIGQLKDMFENKYPNYLALLMYPIGSIYWTGKAPSNGGDPNELFGGTWVQIKNCFIWAKGDSDTLNATGGSKTVTLTEQQIPSHTHNVTADGTISSHTHTVGAHSHGLNSHTHTLNNGNTSSSGTTTTAGIRHSGSTGGMSAHSSGSFDTGGNAPTMNGFCSAGGHWGLGPGKTELAATVSSHSSGDTVVMSIAHTHTLPASYIYGKTDAASGSTANSTAFNSGSTQPTFTGKEVTSVATGGGQAHDNMPPYVVKYCWERTA